MITFLLDETGDIVFDGQYNLRMVMGAEEKQQAIRVLLQTNLGEWFLNTGHGLDYMAILGKKPNGAEIRAVIMEALKQEPRVEEVISLDIDYDRSKRHLSVYFKLRMEGEVIEGLEVI